MATTSSVASIGQDQFLQLLIAQLKNQDPLSPVDNSQFITQLASLNTVQGLQDLNASFAQQLKLQQLTQGADLIGKTIEYLPAGASETRTGKVSSVEAQSGSFVLQVGSDAVTLDQIQSVR
ncbi:flagellar hook capping protein [Gemmata sp. G18]|uniref:Basal-body rod modification protein FlgD n=1 Tax=Gemmata palustris TaxID=2822762 RepID=A0ABS5C4L2_9BACT|nr:flagellar hook capping FlgD N-terminal domain-containing protein [Gemmata palustris]MBP3960895.1 flagellar hook capping protein [Gemmata palustris]